MLAGLMLAVALLWLPLYSAQSIVGLTVAWAMLSAIGPSVQSLLFTIVSLNIPAERRGSVLSMIYLPLNLAFIIGPFTASFVARNLEVRDVFLVSTALAFVALMIFVVNVGRTHEK